MGVVKGNFQNPRIFRASVSWRAIDNFATRTETQAERGAVLLGNVELSRAERWTEDGLHVIRSTEFDCIAEDPDPDGAVAKFVDNLSDLGVCISELEQTGEATEGERWTLMLLLGRFAPWGVANSSAPGPDAPLPGWRAVH